MIDNPRCQRWRTANGFVHSAKDIVSEVKRQRRAMIFSSLAKRIRSARELGLLTYGQQYGCNVSFAANEPVKSEEFPKLCIPLLYRQRSVATTDFVF
jgi:hypothetical protein